MKKFMPTKIFPKIRGTTRIIAPDLSALPSIEDVQAPDPAEDHPLTLTQHMEDGFLPVFDPVDLLILLRDPLEFTKDLEDGASLLS